MLSAVFVVLGCVVVALARPQHQYQPQQAAEIPPHLLRQYLAESHGQPAPAQTQVIPRPAHIPGAAPAPQRIEWLCYLLAIYAGSLWRATGAVLVPVRTPPSNPSTIEAQAKFFQYRHLPTSEDFDQGHRLGSEHHFTERHERSRPRDGLFSAKVRWGDKKGGYGEHYWDLNHAGHTGNHGDDGYDSGNDDGSYREETNDPYDEPSENSPSYGTDEYDPEKSSYEENDRAKRAHPKIKIERKHVQETYEEDQPQLKRKHKEQLQTAETHQTETKSNEERRRRHHYTPKRDKEEEQPRDKKQFVLVVSHKDTEAEQENQNSRHEEQTAQANENQYVPYESGSGVRQRQEAAASAPRLFLEPSTGHVVDRATGQAYVLQPVQNTY